MQIYIYVCAVTVNLLKPQNDKICQKISPKRMLRNVKSDNPKNHN